MKTIVVIEWDEPKEQDWLCADNIKIALSDYCENTNFEVKNIDELPNMCSWASYMTHHLLDGIDLRLSEKEIKRLSKQAKQYEEYAVKEC